MLRFESKLAVVVGAANAIGQAIADRLTDEGARVVAVAEDGGVPAGDASSVAADLVIAADIADPAAMESVVTRCAELGPAVDVLVNCHMAMDWASLEQSSVERWAEVCRVNVLGPVVCTKAFLPLLRRAGRAAVVHLGSIDGTLGNPRVPSYSATKGALVPLTHVMAHELAGHGIRVNCVARAAVSGHPPSSAGAPPALLAATPLGRAAEPSEVAAVVAFLASDEASYVTGSVVPVDGGRSGLTPGTADSS